MVHNHEKSRLALKLRKTGDEIQRQVFPGFEWYWKRAEEACRFLCLVFRILEFNTIGNKLSNVLAESRSAEVFCYASHSFGDSHMTAGGSCMVFNKKGMNNW